MSEPEVIVLADPAACVAAGADRIVTALNGAVAARGRADWATTGGSTAAGLYRRLADPPLRDAVPWPAVHAWWGDDRYVPRDHPASNIKPFDDILLGIAGGEEGTVGGRAGGVPIALENVHPFPTGEAIGSAHGAAWCAARLADDLHGAGLETDGGWPVFDLLQIGVGRDGHLLSVFPGSAAFDASELAMAVPAPTHIQPHIERVTLHPGVVGAARRVLIVAFGADKAPVIGDIFGTEIDPRRWPAQLARRSGATWILDEAAAARLAR